MQKINWKSLGILLDYRINLCYLFFFQWFHEEFSKVFRVDGFDVDIIYLVVFRHLPLKHSVL
jgi:hypothetical protein